MKTSKTKTTVERRNTHRRLHGLVKQHIELLNEILKHQVANLGSKDNEFYNCFTYFGGKMPPWVKKAKRLVLLNAPAEPSRNEDARKTK